MNRVDFDRVFQRLIDCWSEMHYPPGKVDTIFRAVKDASHVDFADAMEEIIGNHPTNRSAPGKALILGYLKSAQERSRKTAASANAAFNGGVAEPHTFATWCKLCANTGLIHAHSRKHPQAAAFVFKCQCEAGKQRVEGFPTWFKEKYRERYEVELHKEPETWRKPWDFELPKDWRQLIQGVSD